MMQCFTKVIFNSLLSTILIDCKGELTRSMRISGCITDMRQYRHSCLTLIASLARSMNVLSLASSDESLKLLRILSLIIGLFHPGDLLMAEDLKPRVLDSNGQVKYLSRETVREIFFMRLNAWPDGSPIRVFVLPDNNPLHIQFAKEILGVYPFQLRSAWDRLVYSGTGVSPTTVETTEEMQERIRTIQGSIGYIGQKEELQ